MFQNVLQLVDTDPAAFAPWLTAAALWGWTFLSALARLTGLVLLSPIFGQRGVSFWMRGGLTVCLALLVAPVVGSRGLIRLPTDGWTAAAHLGGELTLGALLGFGVLLVFAGLKLAGELIDQQAGAVVQEVFDPHSGSTATPSGQLLTIVGTLALLCVSPSEGYLRIVSTLFDSFTIIPAHVVWTGTGVVRLLCELGQTSLSLGLQVAAPILAAGAIVSWGLNVLGESGGSPQATTLLGLPVRIAMSLGILTMCLTGATEALLASFHTVLNHFQSM